MKTGRYGVPAGLPFLLLVFACEAGPRSAGSEPVSVLDSLQGHGESLYADGLIDSSRTVFERELDMARAAGDSIGTARALTWLAQTAWRLGDYEATRRLGEEGLGLKLRAGSGDLFRSYNILGLLAWNEARPLDAIELFDKASAAAEATGDSASLAKVWNNMGLVATSLGRYEDARQGFLAARRAARAIEDPLIEGRTLINLAMLGLEVGEPLAALEHLAEARPLLAMADDAVGEQILLGHLGVAYSAAGSPGRAIATLDTALQRSRQTGLRQEEAINLEQLAELHRDAGNHRRALALFAQAGEINGELGLVDERGIDLRQEARIHAEIGNHRLALQKAMEARRIHRDTGARVEELSDFVTLADLSVAAGSIDEARSHLNAADRIVADLGTRSARVETALARARVEDRVGSGVEVLRAVGSLEDDLRHLGPGVAWEAEALRAKAHARTGRLDRAAEAGRHAIAAVERVRAEFGSGVLRTTFLHGRAKVYADLVDVLLRLGLVEEAFLVSDGSRGRVLLEHLSSTRRNGSPSTGMRDLASGERLLWRIDELVERLDEIDELRGQGTDPELEKQADRLSAELERTRAEYEATLLRAQEHDPRVTALSDPAGDPARVRKALGVGEVLLEYFLLPERLLLFVVDRDSVVVFQRPVTRRDIATQVRIARELAGERGGDPRAGDAVLTRLHELLIEPAAAAGALDGVGRLLIVPHAELEYIPFAALKNARTARYLAQDYVLSHLPSAGSLPLLRSAAFAPARGAPGAAVALAPFPDRLVASVAEVEAFRRALPRAEVHRGPRATEARLRDALSKAGVVHVASHGIMNARNPMFSRIELATGGRRGSSSSPWKDDARFEVHEVLGLEIRSSLVFLSGCETGLGAAWATGYDQGQDYATLAQAFLFAGAEKVVATLWPVEDRGAAAFAERFYSVHESRTAAEALALAQRSMISDPRLRAPYHWAGYRISGR